jgi:hypothetical protein
MRLVLIAALCACGVAAAQPAGPVPDKAKASAAFARGRAHYAAGDYRAAATAFLEAYAADPDPGYLFNAGQAFRFAGDCPGAAHYYRQFLGAVSSAPNLDKVRGYLDEMDACTGRQLPPPPAPPSPPLAAPDAPGATRRHVGLALGGAGLAAIGAGVWFHHDVIYFENRSHRCTAAAPCSAAQVANWDDRGRTASVLAVAAYATGGAALFAGTALYLLGATPSRRSRSPRRPAGRWSRPASRSETGHTGAACASLCGSRGPSLGFAAWLVLAFASRRKGGDRSCKQALRHHRVVRFQPPAHHRHGSPSSHCCRARRSPVARNPLRTTRHPPPRPTPTAPRSPPWLRTGTR